MPAYRSAADLKAMAKGQLLGKYPLAAATFMIVVMLTAALRLMSYVMIDSSRVAGLVISIVFSFGISLLLGVINVGVLFMALKICCREAVHVNDIIHGFKSHPDKIIKIQAVLSGVELAATLPVTIFWNLYATSGEGDYLMMLVVFAIAAYVAYGFVSLVFSQVFFLFLDFEEKSAKELLMMSHAVMDGHKKRLFLLWLGFVPLYLLCALSCFIGFIWVLPYVKVTLANFYMDLMQGRGD